MENLVHTGIRSSGLPCRSESLYRLHHSLVHYEEVPVGILPGKLTSLEEILRDSFSVPKKMPIYFVVCHKSSSAPSTSSPTNRHYTTSLGYSRSRKINHRKRDILYSLKIFANASCLCKSKVTFLTNACLFDT
jgi:hypothetical protein